MSMQLLTTRQYVAADCRITERFNFLFQVLILDDSPPPSPSLAHPAGSFGAGCLEITSAADSAHVYADDNFEEAEMIFSQVYFHCIVVCCSGCL